MTSELRFYLILLWRRLPLFLAVFTLISVAGLFTAMTLPPVYQAQMRLIVESAQIPDQLARSTVEMSAQEQLQLFETRLLTRDNLLDIANRLNVFSNQREMNPDQIVEAMRAATAVRSSSGRNQATVMTLTFESPRPTMTASVLNDYLTFILDEDAQYRTQRAGDTQAFFQQEVDRLSGQLSQQTAKILEFKTTNAEALPEGLNYRRDLQLNLQNRLAQIDRDISGMTEQKQRLQQVFETTGRLGVTNAPMSPDEQRIQSLKSQLAELEAVYASDNPRVVTLRNRISQLEANLVAQGGGANSADPGRAVFDLQISEIDTKIAQLQDERGRVQKQFDEVSDLIGRTPANAIALESLERDYANIQSQYNAAVASLAKASTGERIETLSRGQRVTVIEQPSVPNDPVKPNRKMIAAAGVGAGLVAGLGLVLLLDILSGTIKRSADLVEGLGITPMVTIPYMRTHAEAMRQRMLRIGLSLLIGAAVPITLWLIHSYVMPFDVITQKIAARFGFFI